MATEPRPTLRESRERELVEATRALFDERGMQDAPVEEIARSVGIARGLIYRQFSSKEELFVVTVTDYLDELAGRLETSAAAGGAPAQRLDRVVRDFLAFCREYPAFLDCSLSLMRRPSDHLQGDISEPVWLRLGTSMASCIGPVTRVITAGEAAGEFVVEDPDKVANLLWTQSLGAMHLARIRVGLRQEADGSPGLFLLDGDELVELLMTGLFAQLGGVPPSR